MMIAEDIRQLIRQCSKDDAAYEQLLALYGSLSSPEHDSYNAEVPQSAVDFPTSDDERYRQMFETNRAVKLLIDPATGRILDANSAAVDFYGYTRDQLQSMKIQEINILSDDEIKNEMKRAFTLQHNFFEFQHRLASGEIRDVEVYSSPLQTSEGQFLYSIILDVTRKREAELLYRALFEQSNDGVIILDLEGNHIQANKRASAILGYSLEEIIGTSFRDLVVPDQHDHSRNVLSRMLAGERVPPYERTFRHKDGRRIPIEVNVEVVNDKNGNPQHIQSILRDIGERKRMEAANRAFLEDMKALQELHLELSAVETLDELHYRMIEAAHQRLGIERIGLFVIDDEGKHLISTYGTDPDGQIRDEHDYHEDIHEGHWTYEIVNSPNHALMWSDDELFDSNRSIGRGWKAASALWNGYRAIGYIVCDNFVTGKPARPYEQELISILGSTFGHLIERKHMEEALRSNEEHYRSVVTALSEGIVLHAADGRIESCNPAAEKILGYKAGELLGLEATDPRWAAIFEDGTVIPDEEYPASVTLRTGKPISNVIMGVRKPNEALMWISVNAQPMFHQDETQPYAVLMSFTDITERKEAQNRQFELALEKERRRLLSTFIQNAAHEFRTPLSTISSGAYLMTRLEDETRRQSKAQQVQYEVRRISTLVDMLLTMAKLESGTLPSRSNIDMATFLSSICHHMMSLHDNKPNLNIDIPHEIPHIVGDLDYLKEALEQLIGNAYRFTPEDGTITVSAEDSEGSLVIQIQDTGFGIAEDALPRIFETFWRNDEAHSTPGFGLGLSIAQKIIEAHQGQITVESKEGEGTRFTVKLPIDDVSIPANL